MAKIDREAMARLDGMDYALRRIKSIGMDEFEKELRNRNRTKRPRTAQNAPRIHFNSINAEMYAKT